MADADSKKPVRKHPRTPLSILVQYRFNPYDDFLYEYTSDLSPGGVFLRSSELRPVGAVIYLQFSPRDGSQLIEGMGRVVRVSRPGRGQPAGLGVEFQNMSEETRAQIQALCEGQKRGRARR